MISENGTARLSDFGLSKFLEEASSSRVPRINHIYRHAQCDREKRATNNTNPRWSAPELLRQTGPISTYSDVWSFGMLCLEVLSGRPPYANIDLDVAVSLKVYQGELPDHPGSIAMRNGLSMQLWKLMLECWNLKPDARPSITEVKNNLIGLKGLSKGMWHSFIRCAT